MKKELMIIEYYSKFDKLISIEIISILQRKFDNYENFNIHEKSLLEMKMEAYDYIIGKLIAGYTIQNIEKINMRDNR